MIRFLQCMPTHAPQCTRHSFPSSRYFWNLFRIYREEHFASLRQKRIYAMHYKRYWTCTAEMEITVERSSLQTYHTIA